MTDNERFCPDTDWQGTHTYTASDGSTVQGYVYCAHGEWSTARLAKLVHQRHPDMPRTGRGPAVGRA